jgi:hypothetical protein
MRTPQDTVHDRDPCPAWEEGPGVAFNVTRHDGVRTVSYRCLRCQCTWNRQTLLPRPDASTRLVRESCSARLIFTA